MKSNEHQDITLIQILDRFADDDAARAHLESIRWPNGKITCPHCGCKKHDKFSSIAANPAKKIRAGLRWCAKCSKQFTVTVGTIFEDSHIPLRKWVIAWYLICSSKKGISSLQLQRQLELGSYRTALFMAHRIRYALSDPVFPNKITGTVEIDETYVGGKPRPGDGKKRNFGRGTKKIPVVTVVERGGRSHSQVVRPVTGKNLKAVLQKHVAASAVVMTDEFPAYRKAVKPFAAHLTVSHSAREYVRGLTHTNTVESWFSLLKRGVMGTFHHISEKRLPLYLAEFDHRYTHRKLTDGQRMREGLKKVEGKRLVYQRP